MISEPGFDNVCFDGLSSKNVYSCMGWELASDVAAQGVLRAAWENANRVGEESLVVGVTGIDKLVEDPVASDHHEVCVGLAVQVLHPSPDPVRALRLELVIRYHSNI